MEVLLNISLSSPTLYNADTCEHNVRYTRIACGFTVRSPVSTSLTTQHLVTSFCILLISCSCRASLTRGCSMCSVMCRRIPAVVVALPTSTWSSRNLLWVTNESMAMCGILSIIKRTTSFVVRLPWYSQSQQKELLVSSCGAPPPVRAIGAGLLGGAAGTTPDGELIEGGTLSCPMLSSSSESISMICLGWCFEYHYGDILYQLLHYIQYRLVIRQTRQ